MDSDWYNEVIRKARYCVALNVPKDEVKEMLDILGLLDETESRVVGSLVHLPNA